MTVSFGIKKGISLSVFVVNAGICVLSFLCVQKENKQAEDIHQHSVCADV